jgi:hypothetical protein
MGKTTDELTAFSNSSIYTVFLSNEIERLAQLKARVKPQCRLLKGLHLQG